jgi:AraC family transcriptional regulator of adaptative response / DNA-3-methyladenine glycosylase II
MVLPEPYSWPKPRARAGKLNGKFLIGVLSTGIYCLPSCSARRPKPENVRLFASEAAAKEAGLRACKRCRPDLFYRGEDEGLALFEGLAARVRADPARFANTAALAKACGVSLTKLGQLLRDHAHMAPAAWLRRQRVTKAAADLLGGRGRIADAGFGAGFESESVFHHQFMAQMRMTPGAWRVLGGAKSFQLHLPRGYQPAESLAFHARDPGGLCETSTGNAIWKAMHTPDGPAVLEIGLTRDNARVEVHADRKLSPATMAGLHAAALRMLALTSEIGPFESRHPAFVKPHRGLRLPLIPTGFDALCWGIISQQINLKFAISLRHDFIEIAGEPVGRMYAHPTPERVANLDVSTLRKHRYSGSKASYLIDAARAVVEGRLNVEGLTDGSAVAAERQLVSQRGIGVWTARYVMLRGGFADTAPVGDSALATALQHLHGLETRPGPDQTAQLMVPYAPFRSLATMHLWMRMRRMP